MFRRQRPSSNLHYGNNFSGQQWADTILVDLFQKTSKGENISKNEFDVMIAAYKKDHEQRIDNNIQLTSDQKSKLKNLYNEIADNVKDYCQESLRIEGRLAD